MRLTTDKPDFQMRYPINFVVKHPNLFAVSEKASPEAVETRQDHRSRDQLPSLLLDRRHQNNYQTGGDLEAENEEVGGADRDRTGDPLLAKQVLSQLSYSPTSSPQKRRIRAFRTTRQLRPRWWAWVESNYRPHPYQGCALTN
jgi:hypothetical protein